MRDVDFTITHAGEKSRRKELKFKGKWLIMMKHLLHGNHTLAYAIIQNYMNTARLMK